MLSIVVAIGKNRVIGKNGGLIWHISKDLKHFKEITMGKTIIMGRKTFESLPGVLKNRKHIVLTKNKDYSINHDSVEIINDAQSILKYQDSAEEVFIIGGAEIYKKFLPFCKRMYLTIINEEAQGDAYFPEFNVEDYTVISEEQDEENGINFKFVTLDKK
ncbi:dihydrofolate reductase [Clostridium oryzae]|uniref:Dihydrofolate reductase n=1 Tax=Clostridium oryzae TaxID=1450648 RepID=A0A1V4IE33_9CLOT|nr:dihydrofolate reductase [Clostridium oryzae]OPJ57807.1 dihydrofolate reductase [Clostridium oryzae]